MCGRAVAATASAHITIPFAPLLTNTGTVEVWYNSAGSGDILSLGDGDTNRVNLWYVQHYGGNPNFKMEIKLEVNNVLIYTLLTPAVWTNDTWYHLALTSDGSTIVVCKNGVSQALTEAAGSNEGSWFGDMLLVDNATIGAELRALSYVNVFTGYMSSIRIHNNALSVEQIAARFQAERHWFGV